MKTIYNGKVVQYGTRSRLDGMSYEPVHAKPDSFISVFFGLLSTLTVITAVYIAVGA